MMLNTALRRLPAARSTAIRAFATSSTATDTNSTNSRLLAALVASAGVTAIATKEDKKADCTAIAAVVGKKDFDAR